MVPAFPDKHNRSVGPPRATVKIRQHSPRPARLQICSKAETKDRRDRLQRSAPSPTGPRATRSACLKEAGVLAEKIADQRGYLVRLLVKGKMTGVEDVHLRFRKITLIRSNLRDKE
jgi:hypothetical protein